MIFYFAVGAVTGYALCLLHIAVYAMLDASKRADEAAERAAALRRRPPDLRLVVVQQARRGMN